MNKQLKLAFCLFKYFPFGGLQSDFMNIAKECIRRGYQVDAYTLSWEGERPEGLHVIIVPVSGLSNHKRYLSFADKLNKIFLKKEYNAVVGFNKMPGLDVYFAADGSYAARMEDCNIFSRMTRRYHALMSLERSVFHKDSKTRILLLSTREIDFFKTFYKTGSERFHILPPGISRACVPPSNYRDIRYRKRSELGISQNKTILLMICTNFKIKGVARAIKALASMPSNILDQTFLLIAGRDNSKPYKKLARQRQVLNNINFIGARNDIPSLLMASDLLLHPASIENAGLVLVEALTAHLPVITTDSCGYSFHVRDAKAGIVIPTPFRQLALDKALLLALTAKKEIKWRANAKNYIDKTDVFSCAQKAADVIEKASS